MKLTLKVAVAIASFTIPSLAGMQSADCQSPQPLHNNFRPAAKQDPLHFMQLLDGAPLSTPDIDLENVPPATSVDQANSRFSARAAAAILYAANTSICDGGSKDEQNYGFKILAKMAYADYFLGPDQVPGRPTPLCPLLPSGEKPVTLREEVNASVLQQTVGRVGSSVDRRSFPKLLIIGEYDELLTAYIVLYYKYFNLLEPSVRDKVFNTLLSVRGKYFPGEKIFISISGADFPETENHRLMIQAAKYLTNQLYYQKSVSDGRPDHDNYDNNRNGMVNAILEMLNNFLVSDFVEYNARNYQDYTMTALMNLASYAYDDRIRLAARMVLDYISAKVALSSEDLRRAPPFRRRNEEQHFGPTAANGFLASPLVYNSGTVPGSSPLRRTNPIPKGPFTRCWPETLAFYRVMRQGIMPSRWYTRD